MTYFSVGESRPKRPRLFSSLTMWVEDTDHSHTFVSWKDHLGLRWVAEARGTGIRLVSNKQFKQENTVVNVYRYMTDDAHINNLTEYVWANAGNKYSFKQIYGLLEMRILNKLYRGLGIRRRAVNRFTNGESSQICVEFAIRCTEAGLGSELHSQARPEQWGLIEMREFNLLNGRKQSKMHIDKINGVI